MFQPVETRDTLEHLFQVGAFADFVIGGIGSGQRKGDDIDTKINDSGQGVFICQAAIGGGTHTATLFFSQVNHFKEIGVQKGFPPALQVQQGFCGAERQDFFKCLQTQVLPLPTVPVNRAGAIDTGSVAV